MRNRRVATKCGRKVRGVIPTRSIGPILRETTIRGDIEVSVRLSIPQSLPEPMRIAKGHRVRQE